MFLSTLSSAIQKRFVLWQVPYGNTIMDAENNTWDRSIRATRFRPLLGDPSYAQLNEFMNAGVVAVLFGRGADGATDATDAAKDGVTNPAPINGNTTASLSADDDGGYFRQQAAQYYASGPSRFRSPHIQAHCHVAYWQDAANDATGSLGTALERYDAVASVAWRTLNLPLPTCVPPIPVCTSHSNAKAQQLP